MRILFYSTWGFYEGITQSTVIPIIKSLATFREVEKIILTTTEKDNAVIKVEIEKTDIDSLVISGSSSLAKFFDFVINPFRIARLIKKHEIDLLWCRGAPAGGTGALVNYIQGTTLVVDSFEPHSEYMASSKTWRKSGFKYMLQQFLERLTNKRAKLLLPVSYKFCDYLIKKSINPSKIFVFPCTVNLPTFMFNRDERVRIRTQLNIPPDAIVGIYVGKFGGLYYDDEAFKIYKDAFNFWGARFYLIILTEMPSHLILSKCDAVGIRIERVHVQKAAHSQIPSYLSAADFAFSTIKSVPAMQYCSPIKHGEYWAADLPILSTLNFGDDSDIMKTKGGGIIINDLTDNLDFYFAKLELLIELERTGKNFGLAYSYRNPTFMYDAIRFVLQNAGYKSVK